jgi:hypothetical protein
VGGHDRKRLLKDVGYEDMSWDKRPAKGGGGGAPVDMATNLQAPLKHRNLLSSYQCFKAFDPSS